MAKQTFSVGQVLSAAQMTSLQATAMGGGVAVTKTASYTLVAADAGTVIQMNSASPTTITVNTALFAAGDTVHIQNIGAGACTVTAGTATVNTSGSLILAQYQGGILYFNTTSAAFFYQYATPASGDIEGVTAGTGISGGGTSGTVTITNSMATAIDAKGDLVVGTGSDTFSRLAVGTNGYTLVADSAEATGLKWAAPAGGGKVLQVVQATNSTSQTITSSSYTASNLTASITPSSASSKILVLVSEPLLIAKSGAAASGDSRLMRGATAIREIIYLPNIDATGTTYAGVSSVNGQMYLDSPATTSSTTYKMEYKTTSPATTSIYLGISGGLKSIILMEIGA